MAMSPGETERDAKQFAELCAGLHDLVEKHGVAHLFQALVAAVETAADHTSDLESGAEISPGEARAAQREFRNARNALVNGVNALRSVQLVCERAPDLEAALSILGDC